MRQRWQCVKDRGTGLGLVRYSLMSDSTGFRGDASDKTLVSLLVLLEEIHLTDSLGLASVGGDGWGGSRRRNRQDQAADGPSSITLFYE